MATNEELGKGTSRKKSNSVSTNLGEGEFFTPLLDAERPEFSISSPAETSPDGWHIAMRWEHAAGHRRPLEADEWVSTPSGFPVPSRRVLPRR